MFVYLFVLVLRGSGSYRLKIPLKKSLEIEIHKTITNQQGCWLVARTPMRFPLYFIWSGAQQKHISKNDATQHAPVTFQWHAHPHMHKRRHEWSSQIITERWDKQSEATSELENRLNREPNVDSISQVKKLKKIGLSH